MNAQEYCEMIERKDILHRQQWPFIEIIEDNSPLISLKESGFNLIFEPSIKKDYKYLVREAVFSKIGRISKALDKQEKVLIIRSVWRSLCHQRMLWKNRVEHLQKQYPEIHPKEINEMAAYFIAPEGKSMHVTGGAVDVLIYDSKNECVMDFGTNDGLVIDLNRKCYPDHPDVTPQAKKNRRLLIDLFEEEDFVCDLKEYWHFDYGNVIWAIEKNRSNAIYGVIKAIDDQCHSS